MVLLGFKPATSRSIDRRFSNWANQAAVIIIIIIIIYLFIYLFTLFF